MPDRYGLPVWGDIDLGRTLPTWGGPVPPLRPQQPQQPPLRNPTPDAIAAGPPRPVPQEPEQEFVDWPTYLKMRPDADPADAYEDYVNGVIANAEAAQGATPEQVKETQEAFRQQVPVPARTTPKAGKDEGFFGNLGTAAGQEFKSIQLQLKAAANLNNPEELAKLAREHKKLQESAPPGQAAFRAGIKNDAGPYEYLKSIATSAGSNPQGAFDSTAQFAINAAMTFMAPELAGAGVGALAGGVGALVGGPAAVAGVQSALVSGELGMSLLVKQAMKDGVNIDDPQATTKWLKAGGAEKVFGNAVKGGLTSGVTMGLTLGMAKYAGRMAEGLLGQSQKLEAGAGTFLPLTPELTQAVGTQTNKLLRQARIAKAADVVGGSVGFGASSAAGSLMAGEDVDDNAVFANAMMYLIPGAFGARKFRGGKGKAEPTTTTEATTPEPPEGGTPLTPEQQATIAAEALKKEVAPGATKEEIAGVKPFDQVPPDEKATALQAVIAAQKEAVTEIFVEEQGNRAGRTFETSKGSKYVVGPNGQTIRNKAPRPEHPGDEGIQPASDQTFYVDREGYERLKEVHSAEPSESGAFGERVIDTSSGELAGIRYVSGPHAGTVEPHSVTPISTKPAVGMYPVELFQNGRVIHFGNEITKVGKAYEEPTPTKTKGKKSKLAATKPAAAEGAAPVVESTTPVPPSAPVGLKRGGPAAKRAVEPTGNGEVLPGTVAEVAPRPTNLGNTGGHQKGVRQGLKGKSGRGKPAASAGGGGEATAVQPIVPSGNAKSEARSLKKSPERAGREATEKANEQAKRDAEEALKKERGEDVDMAIRDTRLEEGTLVALQDKIDAIRERFRNKAQEISTAYDNGYVAGEHTIDKLKSELYALGKELMDNNKELFDRRWRRVKNDSLWNRSVERDFEAKIKEEIKADLDAFGKKLDGEIDEIMRKVRSGEAFKDEPNTASLSDQFTAPEGVLRDIEAGTATADRVLTSLSRASDSKLTRVLAHALKQALKNAHIPIEYREGMEGKNPDGTTYKVGGRYSEADGKIYLDPFHGGATNVILHEIVHAATLHILNKPVTAIQRAAHADLTRMMERAKALALGKEGEQYGFKDIKEFVAEAMTNPDFQKYLSRISWKGDLIEKSYWQKFKEIIARTLSEVAPGKEHTVFYNAILKSVDLFDAPREGRGEVVDMAVDRTKPYTTHDIIDTQTGKVVASYTNKTRARNEVDKRDNEYGAVRYRRQERVVNPEGEAGKESVDMAAKEKSLNGGDDDHRFTSNGHVYFQPGARVIQDSWVGSPAKVVAVEEVRGGDTWYKLKVDTRNDPESVDENGVHRDTVYVTTTADRLNQLNPPKNENFGTSKDWSDTHQPFRSGSGLASDRFPKHLNEDVDMAVSREDQAAMHAAKENQQRGMGDVAGWADGVLKYVAWENKDGRFRVYEISPEHPSGEKGKAIIVDGENLREWMDDHGAEYQNRTTRGFDQTPANNRQIITRWKDGKLVYTAIKDEEGNWISQRSADLTQPAKDVPRTPGEHTSFKDAEAAGNAVSPHKTEETSKVAAQGSKTRDMILAKGSNIVLPGEPGWVMTRLLSRDSPIKYIWGGAGSLLKKVGVNAPKGMRLDVALELKNSDVTRMTEDMLKNEATPLMEQTRKVFSKYSPHFVGTTTLAKAKNIFTGKDAAAKLDKAVSAITAIERLPKKRKQFSPETEYIDPNDKSLGRTEYYKDNEAKEKAARDYLKTLPAGLEAELTALMKQWKRFSDKTIETQYQFGRLDRAAADRIKSAYEIYAPLAGEGKAKKLTATGTSAEGSNVFERIIEQRADAILRGVDNNVVRTMRNLNRAVDFRNEDRSKIFKIEPVDREHLRYNPETGLIDVTTVLNPDKSIVYYEGGVPYRIEINNPTLLRALQPFKEGARDVAMKKLYGMAAFYTRMFGVLHTSASPAFGVKNFFRDYGTNLFQLNPKINYGKFHAAMVNPDVWGAAFRLGYRPAMELLKKDSLSGTGAAAKLAKEAHEDGALIAQRFQYGVDQITADHSVALRRSLGNALSEYAAPADGKATNFWTGLTHTLEAVNRLAVYKSARESGIERREAAVMAKNATTNFELGGLARRGLTPLYAFSNAKLQGVRTLGENLGFSDIAGRGTGGLLKGARGLVPEKLGGKMAESANPRTVQAARGAIALGLVAAFANYKASDKDKDKRTFYGKRSELQLDEYLHIPGLNIDIPIPQEIQPFYVAGSSMGDALWGDRAGGASTPMVRFVTAMIQNFSPGGTSMHDPIGVNGEGGDYLTRLMMPTPFLGVYDNTVNMDTFGKPVNPQKGSRTIPPQMQGAKTASPLARGTADMLHDTGVMETSPKAVDHLLLQIFQSQKGTFNEFSNGNVVGGLLDQTFKSFRQKVFDGTNKTDYDVISQQVLQEATREKGSPLKKKQYTGLARDFADTDAKLNKLKGQWNKATDPEAKKKIDEEQNDLRLRTLKKFYEATGVVR